MSRTKLTDVTLRRSATVYYSGKILEDSFAMKLSVFGLFILLFAGLGNATELGNIANSMPTKTWIELPPATGTKLSSLVFESNLFGFADGGSWNPVTQEVIWVGSPGRGADQYYEIRYNVGTDSWKKSTVPFGGTGHAYDGNTVDPLTGLLYFVRWDDPQVNYQTPNSSNWNSLPTYPGSVSATNALAWFPDAFNSGGLVIVRSYGRAAIYDGSKWTDLNPTGQADWGDGSGFAEYNPVHNVVWFGGGSASEGRTYVLDASLTLRDQGKAPISNIKINHAFHVADPASGMYLVYTIADGRWAEFDVLENRWTMNINSQMSNLPGTPAFLVPIPEYNVVFMLRKDKKAFIYRHSPVESDHVAPMEPVNLQAD